MDSLNSKNSAHQIQEESEDENSADHEDVEEEKSKRAWSKIIRCNLDEQTRNVIPELPFKFECSWVHFYKCSFCTNNPEIFYRHIRDDHLVHVKASDFASMATKCAWSECEQMLGNKNRLTEHIRHHSQEKVAACPNCGALFASFTKLIDHCNRSSEFKSKVYLLYILIRYMFYIFKLEILVVSDL